LPFLIWFQAGFLFKALHLYTLSLKHDSQLIFEAFEFSGVFLDGSLTAEFAERFDIEHGPIRRKPNPSDARSLRNGWRGYVAVRPGAEDSERNSESQEGQNGSGIVHIDSAS
jgi:hypothetical protein